MNLSTRSRAGATTRLADRCFTRQRRAEQWGGLKLFGMLPASGCRVGALHGRMRYTVPREINTRWFKSSYQLHRHTDCKSSRTLFSRTIGLVWNAALPSRVGQQLKALPGRLLSFDLNIS